MRIGEIHPRFFLHITLTYIYLQTQMLRDVGLIVYILCTGEIQARFGQWSCRRKSQYSSARLRL